MIKITFLPFPVKLILKVFKSKSLNVKLKGCKNCLFFILPKKTKNSEAGKSESHIIVKIMTIVGKVSSDKLVKTSITLNTSNLDILRSFRQNLKSTL